MTHARLVLLAFAVGGCGDPTPFVCTSSSQCLAAGNAGACVQGACAFADAACPDGFRFEPNAGGGLAGTCASIGDAGMPDAPEDCAATGTCTNCVSDIALGRRFSCAVYRDGAVWCAGENTRGQLGNGSIGLPQPMRVQARDPGGPITDAIAIGAGREHVCAIRTGGTVWCWGAGDSGQLGDGMTSGSAPMATQVLRAAATPLTGIVELSGGYNFTCARDGSGVWCWGANDNGEIGDNSTTRRTMATAVRAGSGTGNLTDVVELTVGGSHACARTTTGALWCWGRNNNLQLGSAGTPLVPVQLGTGTSVAAGTWHSCFVKPDASVSCAGWGAHARLGRGVGGGFQEDTPQLPGPVVQSPGGPPFTGATEVAAGGESCVIMTDSSVRCWGDSQYGQTSHAGSVVPAPVLLDGVPLTGVDRLVAHWAHVCAHTTTGEWLCWGRNAQGELGDGTYVNRGTPVPLKASCP